jgi:long-chain acyl-CoA synthetase
LCDGTVLDLAALDHLPEDAPKKHPLVALFEELPGRFLKGTTDVPVSWYFSLGDGAEGKWTVRATSEAVEVVNAKPDGGVADCVLKTTPDVLTKIIREAWLPGPSDFMAGAVKTNDVAVLIRFSEVFRLG